MSIPKVLARPMLSSIFVAGGLDAVRHPEGKVDAADAVVQPLVQQVPALPRDTKTLVKLNAAVQIGAGTLLATGKLRRLAALALIGSIIPTTYAGHRFWEETDKASRAQQLVHFLKNLGLLGGLILAATDTESSPAPGWRARRQLARLGDLVTAGQVEGRPGTEKVAAGAGRGRRRARRAKGDVRALAEGATDKAEDLAHKAGGLAHKAEGTVHKVGGSAAGAVHKAEGSAAGAAHRVGAAATRSVAAATHGAGGAAHKAGGAAHKAGGAAHKAGGALHKGIDIAGSQVSAGGTRAKDLVAKAHDRLQGE